MIINMGFSIAGNREDISEDILVFLFSIQAFVAFYTIAMSSIFGGIFFAVFLFLGRWKRFSMVKDNIVIWLSLAIILWSSLSVSWALYANNGVDDVKALWFYFLLIFGSVLSWDVRRLRILISVLISGALINFGIAILEYFSLWPLAKYSPVMGLSGYTYRVFLGVITTPIILFMLYDAKKKFFFKNPILSYAVAGLMVLQLALTQGRTGQAVLAILILPFLYLLYGKKIKKFLVVIAAALVLGLVIAYYSPFMQERWMAVVRDVVEFFHGHPVSDVGLRMVFWDGVYHAFITHPLFGIGPGSFQPFVEHLVTVGKIPYIPPYTWWEIEPHNSFFYYLASYGIVGFSLFVSLLIVLFKRAWKVRTEPFGFFQLAVFMSFVVGSFSDVMILRFATASVFMVSMAIRLAPTEQKALQPAGTDILEN